MEARRMLVEERKGSIMDDSFVKKCERKWLPLIGKIKDPYRRGVTAVLMENQAQHLQSLTEETRSANVGEFTKFIFPIIRRVWPNLIANNLCSVQPMTAPVGAIFYFEYKKGTTKGSSTAGENLIESMDRFYSSEYVKGEKVATGTGANPVTGTLQFKAVIPGSISITDGTETFTDDGVGNLVGSAGGTGTVDYITGAVSMTFNVAPALGVAVIGNYKYNMENNPTVPQVNIDISMAEVRAESRKLKALWSSEAADDLRAFHGIDAEAELVSGIASEIALELDRSIVMDILDNATETTDTWSAKLPGGIPEVDHIRSMLTKIATISMLIHQKTLRGPANWIVTSPEVSALLTQLSTHGDFRPVFAPEGAPLYASPVEQPGVPGYGMYRLGVLANRWTVYVDPYMTRNKMLIGLKGASFLDTGYVYAPYIPLQVTPTFLDPNDFSFKKGLRTRYAKRLINRKFFGTLTITDF